MDIDNAVSIINQMKDSNFVVRLSPIESRAVYRRFQLMNELLDAAKKELAELRAYKQTAEAKLKEYERATQLSGEVNAKLVGELLDRQAVPKEVARILERILKWHGEFPETDAFYDGDKSRPISYAAAYGSNGERDFMRGLAATALELLRDPSHIHESEKGA